MSHEASYLPNEQPTDLSNRTDYNSCMEIVKQYTLK